MVCNSCGTDNKATRRFCRMCGQPLSRRCPSCGAANDPDDRFCGDCGAALGESNGGDAVSVAPDRMLGRDPFERRFVAVLFADLVGFTAFSEIRDPEVVRALLTRYYDCAREIITRFGGVVEKYIGDAVMAVWGATVAHEDDAERAVRAGLELTEAVVGLGDGESVVDLAVRVGVLSGEASVAPATPAQGFIVGDLVNTAARLQSIAKPGTVVVGDPTYRMLRRSIEFEQLGEHLLKGKAEPMAVWRAVQLIEDRSEHRIAGLEPGFVGREDELHLLRDALHATERSGRGRLVSLIGEAGIGKSRLAWEFRKYVETLDHDVYWHEGRSPAYDQGLTFWALGEMVRLRAGIVETGNTLRTRTKLHDAVNEFVTGPADQAWIEPRLAALLGLDPAPPGDQSEFFAAIRRFFQSIAQRGTSVLVFEDFNWADEGLVDFVGELVELSPHHPILVITLARPDLLDRVPAWGVGRRNFTAWHLGPLSDAEMRELVEGLVAGISPTLRGAIVERANGIPLYAVELVRMLIADGDLEVDDAACCTPTRDLSSLRVPDTVRAIIGARLDRLPVSARSLLEDAAVLGSAFTSGALAAMSGLGSHLVDELLEPLVHRELLELESDPRSPERGQYRFVQSMIREVAYERLTRDERRIRHERAAQFYLEAGDAELAGAVASHFVAAHGMANDSSAARVLAADAATALSEAAERAASLHSYAQCLGMLEQALSFTDDPITQATLWQRAARAASGLARHSVAIGYARRAFDWFRDHGDDADVAAAAALVGEELCHAFRAPEAIELLQPIVDGNPGLDDRAMVTAGAALARAYLMALRDGDAAELASRVMGSVEQFGLVATMIDCLVTRGTALGNLGRLHEAISLLDGATRYAQQHDLPLAELRAANNLGHLLAFDDHVAALETCRVGMEQANRLGHVRFIASFTWAVSAYLDRDGRFNEARTLRDDVRDRIELSDGSALWYELTDLMVRAERGDRTAIEPAFDAVGRSLDEANPQSAASVPIERARLHLLGGRFDVAYNEVMAVADARRSPDHLFVAFLAAGLTGEAERLQEVASGARSTQVRGRMVDALRSAVDAALAVGEGREAEAAALFAAAMRFGWLRLDRALIQAAFAAVGGTEFPEAQQAAAEAYDAFTDIGAAAYLDVFAAVMPPRGGRTAAGA